MICSFMPIVAQAEIVDSGQCGYNMYWELDSNGTLTIRGTGSMEYYDYIFDVPWNDSRLKIKTVMIEKDVASISAYAFSSCSNLTNISIGDNVTYIGGGHLIIVIT